jgi:hypothetical protein
MRGLAALVAVAILTIGVSACGKYGPPVRSVPQEPASGSQATEPEPQKGAPQPSGSDLGADQENRE